MVLYLKRLFNIMPNHPITTLFELLLFFYKYTFKSHGNLTKDLRINVILRTKSERDHPLLRSPERIRKLLWKVEVFHIPKATTIINHSV